jgi:transposase
MKTLLSRQTSDAKEARRLRAYELVSDGWKRKDIAKALGVSETAVSRWLTRAAAEGVESLRARPHPGSPRRLSDEQIERLPDELEKGAEAFGFRGNVWTNGRIAVVIAQAFGVTYSARNVGRLMKAIGWSRQKPERRARQRDAEKTEAFRKERWPALKRGS